MADKKKKKAQSPNYFMFGLIVLILLAGVYFASTYDWPSHDPEKLVGTWLYDMSAMTVKENDSLYSASSVYFVFNGDGTAAMMVAGGSTSEPGTYKVEGETLTMQFSGEPETFNFVIRGDSMKLTGGDGDEGLTMTRAD